MQRCFSLPASEEADLKVHAEAHDRSFSETVRHLARSGLLLELAGIIPVTRTDGDEKIMELRKRMREAILRCEAP